MKIKIKLNVLIRDKWRCQRCGCQLYLRKSYKKNGAKKAHIHHIKYKSAGGLDIESNLISTCWHCECKAHKRKHYTV